MELKYTGHRFNFERFNRIAPMLLQVSCSTTLRGISVDAVLAVSLMCFGVRLENVKNFRIDVDFLHLERHEPHILRIVKNLDFTRIFPNLKKVYIANNERIVVPELLPDHMNALMEQATAVLREPMPDRAARVKELGFRWNRVTAATEFFVEMFPNIEKLDIATCRGGQSPFRSIWNWLDLKELEVHGNLLPETGNLGSVFCGIFREEVAELRLKDEEYLKNVRIVPVMPAITCMKNLRIISLRHHGNFPIYDEATFLFSKVTVLLAFARRPTLAASLAVSGYETIKRQNLMTHMRTHTGERPFKCKVNGCGMTFKMESALKTHIKYKHSDDRPLKCDSRGCHHAAKTWWDLRKHKKVHSDERPFACPHSGCNFRAKRKKDLRSHTANVHSESKKFACSKCNLKTNFANRFTRHMIIHEGSSEKVPCSVDGCEYKGKHIRALEKHMRLHTTLLPCPVSGCGRHAATNEALKFHMKLHNATGRAFQCPLCFKHYQTLHTLLRHCFVHTNEKPFQCGHCKYESASRSHVKKHISLVHASNEFPLIIHLMDDRECVRCRVVLSSAEYLVHFKKHVDLVVRI